MVNLRETTAVSAPNVTFRPVSAFPELEAAQETTTLQDFVEKEPRMPTVIHMFDSC